MKPRLALLLLVHTGCLPMDSSDQPDAAPRDELAGSPTIGVHDQIGFALAGTSLDRPVAQAGTTYVAAVRRSTAAQPAQVASSDPTVFTAAPSGPLDQRTFGVRIVGVAAGDADLVIRDSQGQEIDRAQLHVRPSDALTFPAAWGGGAVPMLAGSVQRWNVTTRTAGVTTAGVGAVSFQVSGALTAAAPADAPLFDSGGDTTFFRAGASGSGSVTATAPSAVSVLAVSIVAPAAITSVTASPNPVRFTAGTFQTVSIQGLAGTTPVYGMSCAWSGAGAVNVAPRHGAGDLSGSGAIAFDMTGTTPGTYPLTCTAPGGRTVTVSVQVQ